MNSFTDLLKTRRSIRKYLPNKIEPEKIKQITLAALMSPASKRSNPWEFIVVQNTEMLEKLSECRPYGSQLLANAPLAIIVIADTTKSDVWVEDASISAIIIQLEAHSLGLGSCWVQVRNRKKDDNTETQEFVRTLLEIPENYCVLNIISIGYPNEDKKPFDEEKIAFDKIHEEKF